MLSSLIACLSLGVLCCRTATAQQTQAATLRLDGITPNGARMSATSSWGAFSFTIANLTDTDRQARVLVFFKDLPDVQYGREVWVPAHATLSTWMLVGPAPADLPTSSCDLQMEVEDLSQGKNQRLLPPTEERIRSRAVSYRRREPTSAILLDDDLSEGFVPGQLPQPDSKATEAERLVRVFRQTRTFSERVQRLDPNRLPPTAEAFAGIDHLIVASGRLAGDSASRIALRHWLEQGGKIWVMLDLVEPELLAPLLGDALDFQVVDRVGLTTFRVETHPAGKGTDQPPLQQHDRPIEFVRVQLPPGEHVTHSIDGWPVWFSRRVGRGEVIFSTLGPRGWYRPRTSRDPVSPYEHFPKLPVAESHLEDLGTALHPSGKESPFRIESLQPLLAEEIGYSVVRRDTVVLIFGAALLASLGLGIILRKSRRPELLGWLGPAAALGATFAFLIVGERSRRAVPATVAVAQIIESVAGKNEAAVHGLLEIYRPEAGPLEAGAEQGGLFQIDNGDRQGQVRRFILTDQDAWHWERISLPAAPQQGSFHATVATEKPIVALARFGATGVEGNLAGPFQNLSDALLCTPTGRKLAVHVQPDGAFRASGSDALPKGQYLSGAILTDRQQRRQDFYGIFLKEPGPSSIRGRNALLAWTDPLDMHFRIAPEARRAGSALVVAPLRFERLAAGERTTIPGAFLPYHRLLDSGPARPTMESSDDVEMHLRFQLPAEVLPFQVERARLSAKMEAAGRVVTIAAKDGDRFTQVHRIDSPLDPLRVEISEERLLHLDDEGGLHLVVTIGDPSQADALKRPMPRPEVPPGDRPRQRFPQEGRFQGGPRGDWPPQDGPPRRRPPGNRPPPGVPPGAVPAGRNAEQWGEKWTIEYLELEVSGQALGEHR